MTVIPLPAPNRSRPVEVIPKAVPRVIVPVVVSDPVPIVMDESFVLIPPTDPN